MSYNTDWMLDNMTDEDWRDAIDEEINALPEVDDEPSELEDARADEAFWAHGSW